MEVVMIEKTDFLTLINKVEQVLTKNRCYRKHNKQRL